MRVLIASEAHFLAASDGCVYAEGPEDYPFWARYRECFDEVGVLARLHTAGVVRRRHRRADGEGVVFCALDEYRGPWEYLRSVPRLRRRARQVVDQYDGFVLRAPGAVAYLVWQEVRRRGKPYAVEVLGDPWESLGPASGAGSLLRPVARRWSRWRLGRICRQARLTCYVTRNWLQQRYPPARGAAFACSDVRLAAPAGEQEMIRRLDRIQQAVDGRRRWEAGFIGSLESLYKAPDIHLKAIALCCRRGFDIRFSVVGEGRHRRDLEQLAAQLGISGAVRFLGAVPHGPAIEEFLDSIDLFVLASHTEGMPRALIEAMARGCPAIGSAVGGIPELLGPASLVEPGCPEALAAKIIEMLGDPVRLSGMARANLDAARQFAPERLDPLRREFLCRLRNSCT